MGGWHEGKEEMRGIFTSQLLFFVWIGKKKKKIFGGVFFPRPLPLFIKMAGHRP